MATYGIFGWIFTVYRAITSMIIAMVAGILTNIFDKDDIVEEKKPTFSSIAPQASTSFSMNAPTTDKSHSTSQSSCCTSASDKKKSFSFLAAMHYAFTTLLGDIAKPLFLSLGHLSL